MQYGILNLIQIDTDLQLDISKTLKRAEQYNSQQPYKRGKVGSSIPILWRKKLKFKEATILIQSEANENKRAKSYGWDIAS